MTTRIAVVLAALVALGGCKSSESGSGVVHDAPDQRPGGEDRELYWYQRGADATKAIWAKFRLSDDVALVADGNGGIAPSYRFSTYAFDLLLDNVSTFWRKDLATEAVDAYFGDFSRVYPDRAANFRNGDVLRWAAACTRASLVTGKGMYLEEARKLYDALWLQQVDNTLGGGMWHRNDARNAKSASANLCAVIVALNLYHATQDVKYLLQGRKLYKWTAEHLFDKSTGAVCEGILADGRYSTVGLTGDIGLFVGASMRLYRATGSAVYLANAKKAADRMVGAAGPGGIVRCAEYTEESISNGIALRHLAELARRPGCERYREFILANARAAWTSRRLSDGLNGPDWAKTPFATDDVLPPHAVSAAFLYFAASRACR